MSRMDAGKSKKIRALPPLALVAGLAMAGCEARSAEPPPAKERPVDEVALKVAVARVEEAALPVQQTFSGSLVADRSSVVAAGATGKVETTLVERGDYVEKGQVLARLDQRQARATLAEAEAQLATAKEQAALSRVDCDRNEQLHARQALSDAEYDRARSSCATTKFSVQAAQARRDSAANALRDTEIRAPFAGFVEERWVSVGEYVTAANKVATVVSVDPIRAQLTVPEHLAHAIAQGQTVTVEVAGPEGITTAEGVIRYVSPSIRATSRDLLAEALVKNPQRTLRPGSFVVAKVDVGQQKLPTVPASAIGGQGASRHLFAIVGGTLEQRIVQLGPTRGDKVSVVRGVSPGETVAAVATPDLRDGGRVQ